MSEKYLLADYDAGTTTEYTGPIQNTICEDKPDHQIYNKWVDDQIARILNKFSKKSKVKMPYPPKNKNWTPVIRKHALLCLIDSLWEHNIGVMPCDRLLDPLYFYRQ